jgi:hypothetical protein
MRSAIANFFFDRYWQAPLESRREALFRGLWLFFARRG